ncbi:HAMP domain-containing protein [Glaciihabitans sp. dw_435]|uniref:HAMP domain-containing protein n=1 Tax=Glaciihabitans sp. dw_435 TaxID=2720081 RepID=UPI001BD1CA5F|nr:HAMP domain-containing protein [Glaciihabitans sp. dw_435]
MSGQKPRRFAGARFSVRSRILASILLVAALGLTGAGGITFLVQRDRALSQIDDRLQSRIESARAIVSKGTAVTDASGATTTTGFASSKLALYGVLQQLIPDSGESALGIYQGEATYTPGVQTDFHLEDDPAFIARVTRDVADGTVRLGTAVTSVGRLRYIATPVSVAGADTGAVYVTAVDLDARLAEVTESFRTYELVASAALVAIGLVGWFVAGRLLRPIRRLSAAASRITASERNERIPVVGRDDVSLLTETVNSMLDRLDAALTGQRQLLDDVRHELKTPITIVRGHLELLNADDPAEVEATRVLALDELDRMTGLVDDIESLADSQRIAPVVRPTDIADLTEEVFAKASGIGGHDWVLGEVCAGECRARPRADHPGVAPTRRQRVQVLAGGLAGGDWQYRARGRRLR